MKFVFAEHKLVGDLGSQHVLEALAPGSILWSDKAALLTQWTGALDNFDGNTVRLVNRASLKKARQRKDRIYNNPFQPREDAGEATKPLLVWVGTADKNPATGSWFTFGDLVATYGDLRRIVTCDYTSTLACTFVDDPKQR
jgi:hypothetical protein